MLQVCQVGVGFFPTSERCWVSSARDAVQHGKMNLRVSNSSSPALEEVCPEV